MFIAVIVDMSFISKFKQSAIDYVIGLYVFKSGNGRSEYVPHQTKPLAATLRRA